MGGPWAIPDISSLTPPTHEISWALTLGVRSWMRAALVSRYTAAASETDLSPDCNFSAE